MKKEAEEYLKKCCECFFRDKKKNPLKEYGFCTYPSRLDWLIKNKNVVGCNTFRPNEQEAKSK